MNTNLHYNYNSNSNNTHINSNNNNNSNMYDSINKTSRHQHHPEYYVKPHENTNCYGAHPVKRRQCRQ